MKDSQTGPQRTGPSPLGVNPLNESDPHSQDDTSAAEAAAWLKNPAPAERKPSIIDRWESEPEWQGPPVEDPADPPVE